MGRRYAPARYRELGTELRKRREAAGLTSAELAGRSGWSMSTISRIETGQRAIEPIDAIAYLGWCDLFRPHIGDMVELCREAEQAQGYWVNQQDEAHLETVRSLIYHESTAQRSITYEPQLVPGLLQTPDYAHTLIAKEQWRNKEDVARCVRVRMDRQRILNSLRRAQFTFFVHEQALRLEVGSATIMQEQLLQIVLNGALDEVSVRVVPSSAALEVFDRPFRVFEFAEHRPLVYLENYSTGVFLEDPAYVEPYRTLVPAVSEAALDEGQSRELIATVADEFERGSLRDDDDHLEEE